MWSCEVVICCVYWHSCVIDIVVLLRWWLVIISWMSTLVALASGPGHGSRCWLRGLQCSAFCDLATSQSHWSSLRFPSYSSATDYWLLLESARSAFRQAGSPSLSGRSHTCAIFWCVLLTSFFRSAAPFLTNRSASPLSNAEHLWACSE